MPSNDPKILVEFSPEEAAWLADRLHEVWAMQLSLDANLPDSNARELAKKHKATATELLNRVVDKADIQGFGHI